MNPQTGKQLKIIASSPAKESYPDKVKELKAKYDRLRKEVNR